MYIIIKLLYYNLAILRNKIFINRIKRIYNIFTYIIINKLYQKKI